MLWNRADCACCVIRCLSWLYCRYDGNRIDFVFVVLGDDIVDDNVDGDGSGKSEVVMVQVMLVVVVVVCHNSITVDGVVRLW